MGCILAGLRLVPVCSVLFVGLFGFVFLWFSLGFSACVCVGVWSSGSVSVPALVLVSLFVFACFGPCRVCFRLCLCGGPVPCRRLFWFWGRRLVVACFGSCSCLFSSAFVFLPGSLFVFVLALGSLSGVPGFGSFRGCFLR